MRIAAALMLLLASAAPAADLPRKAPEFTINLPGGKALALSQYQGRVVVFAFIETFCQTCQKTVGTLSKLQNEYGPRGLQVLATAIDPEAQAALPLFLKNYSPSFPVGTNAYSSAAAMIHPTAPLPVFPLIAILDRGGVIRYQHEGAEPDFDNLDQNLRKEIAILLKSPAPAKK